MPQGSVLGPLLFILYINDLPDDLTSKCKLFADDTKIYSCSNDNVMLQNDVLALFEWSRVWQLNFNVSKCKTLHIGRTNPCHNYYTDSQKLTTLTVTTSEKDLGVMFDQHLSFDLHIHECVNRANRMMGIIFRSFVTLNKQIFLSLYKSLVRSVLEYGNVIWSPLFKRQSICVENVQRRATRSINEISHLCYEERLKYLDLPSLKYRRMRGDLIQLYKIVHNLDKLDSSQLFTYSQVSFTRGDRFKIYMDRCKSNLRQNSFIFRTLKNWNSLSFECKSAKSLNAFNG